MKKIFISLSVAAILFSCNSKDESIITPNPSASEGSTITVNGIAGGEPGSQAGNSVYIDFSTDVQTPVLRAGWDLGFYCGSDFRVIINHTTAATAYVTDKINMNDVSPADTIGVKTAFNMAAPEASDFNMIDDLNGDITKTIIPAISNNSDLNKVIIINRGIGAGTPARDYYKIKINRNSEGYTLQYAKLDETTFKTTNISKDPQSNFKLISFDNGLEVAKPQKQNWDIVWGASIYQTSMGSGPVPYTFSDLVAINHLAGTQVAEKEYDDIESANTAYDAYDKSALDAETFVNNRWTIGSNWRKTATPGSTTPSGTIKNKFYIIKDSEGNAYKVKFISFSTDDGGERGRPEIKYALIK